MNIYAKEGDKVVYRAVNGSCHQLEMANRYLEKDVEYTVIHTEVSGWHTDVYLKEVPSIAFNSVHFSDETDMYEEIMPASIEQKVLAILEDCDHLDDAKMWFQTNKLK